MLTDREAELDLAGAVRIDEIASDEGALGPVPEHAPVLILTTGTTGHQKGARHDWSRLIGAVRNPDPEPGARWLLAYNLNQFAGVQVLLHVLTSGATLVAPASRRPRDVIEAIRDAPRHARERDADLLAPARGQPGSRGGGRAAAAADHPRRRGGAGRR